LVILLEISYMSVINIKDLPPNMAEGLFDKTNLTLTTKKNRRHITISLASRKNRN